MKEYAPKDIRNFAVTGASSSGKTSLVEAMLFTAGVTNRMGTIAAGNTISDYHADEQDHQMSMHTSLLHLEWQDTKFNILDTPGSVDFSSEMLCGLRVADFALIVMDSSKGIDFSVDRAWEEATRLGLPKIMVFNKIDSETADMESVLEEAREHFGAKIFPMTIPLHPGPSCRDLLDVMRSEVVEYARDESGTFKEKKAEGDDAKRVKDLHRQLIEFVAETDDSLMEEFFERETITEEELRAHLHDAIQQEIFVPFFATSATHNVGVARLLDFIAKYGANPADHPSGIGLGEDGTEKEVSLFGNDTVAYIFKSVAEAHVGDLSFFRVYSGTIQTGMDLYNSDHQITERIGQIFLLNGKEKTPVRSLGPGEIGTVVKLRDTYTGDTLSPPKNAVRLPRIAFPKPNIHGALRLKARGDEEKVANGLAALHKEDPSFLHRYDSEMSETIISGQGEIHLQAMTEALKRRYNVEIELVEPRVPYRETIRGRSEAQYRHKKQSGGAGQFAEVWLRIEPLPRDSGVEFSQSLVGQDVDRVFVPSVEKGVKAAVQEGVVAGYRIMDVKVDFHGGKMHPVDSKDIAFQIAGKAAFQDAFAKAKPCLLEPHIKIEAVVPNECTGDVIGDLSSRRGKIQGMDQQGALQIIRAVLPQAELYRYATRLNSLTGGRGRHTEEFSHYEELPRELESKVIEAAKKHREANHH